ncbi:MAG: hypothetical protein WDN49_24075 [Acetobacteraceae bacterium]
MMNRRAIHPASLVLQIALIAVPLVIVLVTDDNALLDSLTQVLIWAALALSWNILGGYARQISVGHVAFYGIGAYTSTLLGLQFAFRPGSACSPAAPWPPPWALC